MSELNLQIQGMVCGIFRILKVRVNCSVELLFVLMYVQAERGFAIRFLCQVMDEEFQVGFHRRGAEISRGLSIGIHPSLSLEREWLPVGAICYAIANVVRNPR